MGEPFGARLREAVAATGPLCAGIDPSRDLLADWGLPDDASGLDVFGRCCVEAFAGVLPLIKPQVAFFERHGSRGLAALERLVDEAGQAGLLVLNDAKRGDIDSTCAAYADAWLSDDSALAGDALTAHPYLGLGALAPLIDAARASGRAVFVVARSSNPERRVVQLARASGEVTVEDALLAEIAAVNTADGGFPGGPVGAVVGATLGPSGFELGGLGGPVLAPGLGAQGAGPADVAWLFARCPPGSVVPSASRSLLSAGPDPAALRRAAVALRDELAAVVA
jgi:orotidine-5'-phosphate decarboxylase